MHADTERVEPRAEKRLSSLIAQAGAALAAGLGIAALLGWVVGLPLLAGFEAGSIPMPPSTALLFALYGSAVFIAARTPLDRTAHRIGMAIGAAGAALALLLLVLSSMGLRIEAEHLGIAIAGTVSDSRIGHMSPVSALCFVLAGSSLVAALASSSGRPRRAMVGFWLACPVILAGIVFLLAYLFGTPLLYGGNFIPPALTTSVAFTALGAALLAFAAPGAWAPEQEIDAAALRTSRSFVLVFAFLAAALVSVGTLYFRNHERHYRRQVEHQLSAIVELKAGELAAWRAERLADASALVDSTAFSGLVRRALGDSRDAEAWDQLQGWLRQIRETDGYDKVFLLDAQGVARISIPVNSPLTGASEHARETLRSGKVAFVDFHRDAPGEPVRLSVLAPIAGAKHDGQPLGVVVLEIDPAKYLYPAIERWPVPSRSGEFLLVRRDGNDVLILNELRFRKNAALSQRFPLSRTELPAVKAALGQEGIVEGVNSHGEPVTAAVRAVPDSPWVLVASIDTAEILESTRQDLWLTASLVGALLLAAGTTVGLIWRHQRVRHYKQRFRTAAALAHLKDLYDMLSQTNQAIVRMTRREELFPAVCRIAVEHGRFRFAWISLIDKYNQQLQPAAEYGEDAGFVAQKRVSADASDPAGRGPSGQALRTGNHAVSNDFLKDPATTPWHQAARRAGVRAAAAFPVRESGIVVGVMTLCAGEPGFFTEDMLPTLDEMALDVSFALDNFAHEAELARAVEASRESGERFRATFEQAAVGMAHVAPDGRWLRVNQKLCDIVGYTREELLACNSQDITHPDDLERDLVHVRQLLAAEIPTNSMEKRYLRKDGEIVWINLTVALVRQDSGEPDYFISVVEDISARKHAETVLRDSEARFRDLFEQNPLPIFALDKETLRFLTINQAAIDKYGYSREEFLAMTILDLQFPEDRVRVDAELQEQYARDPDEVVHRERRHVTRNGRIIFASIVAQPLKLGNHQARLISVSDLTERMHLEDELHRLNQDLERRIEERTSELQEANRELQAFSYSVSHDLRVPLRAIDGFSRIIEDDYAVQLDETGRELFARVRAGARRMGQLIDDLLRLSQISRQAMRLGPVDLSALARQAAEELQAAEPARRVEWVIAPGVMTSEGDTGLLRVVMQNLIGNAWKYSARRDGARIEFGAAAEQSRHVYFVRDNGAGFDMAYAGKLFGAFQRLHSSAEFPGTGIGLATVARVIRRHGGEVRAEGRVGEGACFYFTLGAARQGS